MFLIADGGSTKTDWSIVSGNQEIDRIKTRGINPFFQTEEDISAEIRDNLVPKIKKYDSIEAVYFYGAGCAFPEKNEILRRSITHYLPVPVEVGSDLLAAARALCGNSPGIACILGTGSNSCLYDGKDIIKNISPLGFILGDEGSGAVLGKLLVGDVLKNQLPVALQEAFFAEFGLTPAVIMEKVYKQPFPNRFLASLSPFLLRHIEEPSIHDLVSNSFRAFFARNVMQYGCLDHPVHLIGSIAWYYQDLLKEIACEFGFRLGTIAQSPVQGLIRYHSVL
ncbi:ATPase [Parabacteroides johnsonii]|uniref:ATPase n=1 Tax=Parabacteroides johnsonii TaxID=387661 RepID=UPI00242A73AB|nr:ATPase [Parabacteroides johnsonii]